MPGTVTRSWGYHITGTKKKKSHDVYIEEVDKHSVYDVDKWSGKTSTVEGWEWVCYIYVYV